ncbi:hypothetical protein [Yoonia sp.]|uniref:hypothetical protein n=1 Tax=Yoonia sp. TaxID=2212373 RepID=UPI00391BDE99
MRVLMRKGSFALTAALLVVAGQVQALSCLAPDAVRTFIELDAASETYVVLHGSLSFDENNLPPFVQDDPVPDPAPIMAEFTGKGLTTDGFTFDYTGPVVLQVTCAGPWCGTAQSDQDAVIFVAADETPVTVTADPCGGRLFYNPTPETIAMLTSCMQGGACSPE